MVDRIVSRADSRLDVTLERAERIVSCNIERQSRAVECRLEYRQAKQSGESVAVSLDRVEYSKVQHTA
jgi:hypothetical protein